MATWYISPTGSDSNTGKTTFTPFATVAHSISKMSPGDTLLAMDGTYTTATFFSLSSSGTDWNHAYTLKALHPKQAQFITTATTAECLYMPGSYWIVDGLDVQAPNTGVGISPQNSHIKIRNCAIHNVGTNVSTSTAGGGIDVNYPSLPIDITIENNEVYNCGVVGNNQLHGIYVASVGGGVVQNNLVHDNHGNGIQCWHQASNWTVQFNTLYNNGDHISAAIIFGNGDSGAGVCSNMVVVNNIIHTAKYGIRTLTAGTPNGSWGTGNVIANNLVFNCTTNYLYDTTSTGGPTATGTLTADPQFALLGTDYHLKVFSPARKAAAGAYTTPYDKSGITRPSGAQDLGCYCYNNPGLVWYMQGQDITPYVAENSDLDIQDTLGQGAGTFSSQSGKAKQLTFLASKELGSAVTAVGAATVPTSPILVRAGDVQVYDVTGTLIYGGKVQQLEDKTDRTTINTKVTVVDYYQFLDQTVINEVFDGQGDVYILNYLLTKYAPWVDVTALNLVTPTMDLPNMRMVNKTLKDGIQMVADKTGYVVWILPNKSFQYANPVSLAPAPFSISDSPDYFTSFPGRIDDYLVDDTALVNRVYFYGGKTLSKDFTQDMSPQANGNNKVFVLAYYPHVSSDGKYHVYVSGVELVIGFFGGTGVKNILKSAGGLADVLVSVDSHTLTFDVAPTAAQLPQAKYRYEYPLIVTLTNQASFNFFGAYFDGVIVDQNVFNEQVAINRCKTMLLEQAFGLTTLKFTVWKSGIQAGQQVKVVNSVRSINSTYIVQEVEIKTNGAGNYEYQVTAGAWNWGLVDLLHVVARQSVPDSGSDGSTVTVQIEVVTESGVGVADALLTVKEQVMGQFYARATAVGDGHDAYPGFFTVLIGS